MSKEDTLESLDQEELVALAMLAFLKMKKDKILTDKELLEDILLWFSVLTLGHEYDIIEVEPLGGSRH